MGKLDKIIAMEQSRHAPAPDASLATLMMAASDNVNKFEQAIGALNQRLDQAESNLGTAVSGISIPDHRGDLAGIRQDLVEIAGLMAQQVAAVHDAVKSIKMPEPPVIPEQVQTDLSPVMQAIADIKVPDIPDVLETRHSEWEFDIERDQYGIKKVIAKPI